MTRKIDTNIRNSQLLFSLRISFSEIVIADYSHSVDE